MNNKEILDYYNAGHSLAKTARKSNLSVRHTKDLLTKLGCKTRSKHEQNILENMRRGKKIDHNYFQSLNDKKAYYLGFLYADGCVRPNRNEIKIGLSSIDRSWLEDFQKELQSERTIKDYTTNKGFLVSELIFSSLQIKSDLAKYGIVPSKTYKKGSLKVIPKDFQLAFIKGFIDGDGSIIYYQNTNQVRLSVVSYDKNILEDIKKYFNLHCSIVQNKQGNWTISYSTLPAIEICTKLYDLNTPCLERKYKKFLDILEYRLNPRAKEPLK